MQVVPTWETIPFHFIWVSITILYGFRVWRSDATIAVLIAVMATTGAGIAEDVRRGSQTLAELTEVPLMAAMFAAMVWHARRRLAATRHMTMTRGLLWPSAATLSTPLAWWSAARPTRLR